ncbi:hypothetical protein [Frigoriflavimonas asaccharolytica]|uniref:Uncharacterized protein n=1 Tax=Frigoriflavimonas asaccharolytica TaxID=2735899 RepID=A0A8J8K3W4_9FLAO|nr:hypothetical protein [Frigoriflavimonas asaccharolytica]NRS91080.1 hypothetical protein [Frigoriflavimonas asaccharolytica]
MKNILLFLSLIFFANAIGQQKTTFADSESLLKEIKPEKNITSWMLISNEYGRSSTVKSYGKKIDFEPQEFGFQLIKNEDQFYYIAYLAGNSTKYIKDSRELKSFLGTINTPEEAAIVGILGGYFMDLEFKNLAGNYIINKDNYIVELAKITTTNCPLAKNHYELIIDKKTGNIISTKDNGAYNEIYDKTCTNNPHNAVIEKQMKDAEAKKVQDAIDSKDAREQAKKKLQKSMNRR